MGTKYAPAYTNIFMRKFEKKYIFQKIKDTSTLYLRYINKTFTTWTGSLN